MGNTANAKIRNLCAKPSQSANLSFQVEGVLNANPPMLGITVSGLDFSSLYSQLPATTSFDASLIKMSPENIDTYIKSSVLFSLRAESLRSTVSDAIAKRQNAYLRRYKNQPQIISTTQQYFNSRPGSVNELDSLSTQMATLLNSAYSSERRTGVVKSTSSVTNSTTSNTGNTSSITNGTVASSPGAATSSNAAATVTPVQAGEDTYGYALNYDCGYVLPSLGDSNAFGPTSYESYGPYLTSKVLTTAMPSLTTTNTTTSVTIPNVDTYSLTVQTNYDTKNEINDQLTTNTGYEYRVPMLENQIRQKQTMLAMQDEKFSLFMQSQGMDSLAKIFDNELGMLDNEVKRYQCAYLDTVLIAPFNGQVTGIFKSPGDFVRRGEAVVRLENFDFVYLVGTIIYRGLINLGATITVTTSGFGDANDTLTISGTVSAIRGHRGAEDEWDLIIYCKNQFNQNPPRYLLPPHYQFDFDDTTVTIS